MKYVFHILQSFFLLFILNNVTLAHAEEPSDTVLLYFESIRNGDVENIKSFLGGNLLKKRKVLLEENEKYSDFLRDRFGEAKFTVEGSPKNMTDTTRSVLVRISFNDGTSIYTNMVVQETVPGGWKIVDQLQN